MTNSRGCSEARTNHGGAINRCGASQVASISSRAVNSAGVAVRSQWCLMPIQLWRKEHHLGADGYGSHQERLGDWCDARSDEFFLLGSRDETAGCQLCAATIADDGALSLRLRMPDCLAEQYVKYLVIPGVRFAHGHEQVLAALGSNAEYAAYRRPHGEKVARATDLGQAIGRWGADGAAVITQGLRYPPTWPTDPGSGKRHRRCLGHRFRQACDHRRLRCRRHDVHRHRPAAGAEVRPRPRSRQHSRCSSSLGYSHG